MKYIPGDTAGDLPGFIINNYQWVTASPDTTNHGFIYLKGKVDSSYINKRVRAVGEVRPSTSFNYIMNVDTLDIIN